MKKGDMVTYTGELDRGFCRVFDETAKLIRKYLKPGNSYLIEEIIVHRHVLLYCKIIVENSFVKHLWLPISSLVPFDFAKHYNLR